MKTRLSISERRRARARMDQPVDDQPKTPQGELIINERGQCQFKIDCHGVISFRTPTAEDYEQIVRAANMHNDLINFLKRLQNGESFIVLNKIATELLKQYSGE